MVKIVVEDPSEERLEFVDIKEAGGELLIFVIDTADYFVYDICEVKLGKLITTAIKRYFKKEE